MIKMMKMIKMMLVLHKVPFLRLSFKGFFLFFSELTWCFAQGSAY